MSESTTSPAPRKRDGGEKRTSPFTFYRQVIAELRKVVWPTQQQLTTYFIVVLVFVLIMMAIVSLLDLGLGKFFFMVFNGRD
ncbi:MAG: preprotein translocase subunit SecE [Nocardioides sp.]|uniref:preprotein translocase subunit SecE n=1 Tax=Nocardioides sp. TaxID=35761 RepID=UPI0039E371B9